MPKTYGLMFKDEMIRAYLAGVKTQTRRLKGLELVNENPDNWELMYSELVFEGKPVVTFKSKSSYHFKNIRLPYGDTSNTFWFREAFQVVEPWGSVDDEWIGDETIEIDGRLPKEKPEHFGYWQQAVYRADDPRMCSWWRTSMFMPHWISRFQEIPILSVRVERLQDITPADAFAEGVRTEYLHQKPDWMDVDHYHQLWDRINGKTFPWSRNPWVFVYTFPKYNKE